MESYNTNEELDIQLPSETRRKKRRYHGNPRNQRFRRRCRAQNMKPATIVKLLEKRNRNEATVDGDQLNGIETTSNKRKRNVPSQEMPTTVNQSIPKSISSISILQLSTKKMKNEMNMVTIPIEKLLSNVIMKNYRYVAYLF